MNSSGDSEGPIPRKLFDIKQTYAALRTPSSIILPTHLPFAIVHDFLLHSLLLDPHFKDYPPSKQYQKVFWKWAITTLERHQDLHKDEDLEIDSRLYDFYTNLLTSSSDSNNSSGPDPALHPPSPSFLTYYWRSRLPKEHKDPCLTSTDAFLSEYTALTLKESRTTIENGTTGLRTWLASFVLTEFLTLHPDIVAGQRVLELGAGTGFLGIIVAALQLESPHTHPGSLFLTDVDEGVLSRCRDNVQLHCNKSSSHPEQQYLLLDWSDALDEAQIPRLQNLFDASIRPDVILGADLVFDRSLIPPLVATLVLLLQPNNQRSAIIALTVRNENTVSEFVKSAEEKLYIQEIYFDRKASGSVALEIPQGGADVNMGVKIFKICGTK